MAQSGYTPIQLYRTTTASAAPTAGNLAAGELAINLTDEKLYFKNAGGTVKVLATSGAASVGGSDTQVQYNNNGVLAGSANFVFTSTGVGVGASSPKTRLQVSAAGTLNAPVLGSATGAPFYMTNSDPAYGLLAGVNAADGHVWLQSQRTDGSATAANISLNEAGGNVGIGTAGPNTKLQVAGIARLEGAGGEGGQLELLNVANTAVQAIFDVNSSNVSRVLTLPAGPLVLGTNSLERVRIDASGNVGIGTSSPSTLLDVNGSATLGYTTFTASGGEGGQIVLNNATNTAGAYSFDVDGSNHGRIFTTVNNTNLTLGQISGTGGIVAIYTAGSEHMRVDASGNVGIGTTSSGSKLHVAGTVNFTGALTSGDLADAVGYKGLPQNSQTTTYTLAMSDMGKHVYVTAAAFTVTIPANATTAFPIGTAISIICEDAAKTLAPAATVTLILAGTGGATTGNRTLAIGSVATIIKVGTNRWFVSGAGVT